MRRLGTMAVALAVLASSEVLAQDGGSTGGPWNKEVALVTSQATLISPPNSSGTSWWLAIQNKGANAVSCAMYAKGTAAPTAAAVVASGWKLLTDSEVANVIPTTMNLYCTVSSSNQTTGAGTRFWWVSR